MSFYKVKKLWEDNRENSTLINAIFYPLSIENFFTHNTSSNRTMPYAIPPNIDIKHKATLNLPEPWNVQPLNTNIENDYFSFNQEVHYTNNQISISYHYKTHTDHVKPEDMGMFLSDNKKAKESLGYQLTYNKALAKSRNPKAMASSSKESNSFSIYRYIPILLTLISIGVMVFVCIKLYYNYNLPRKSEPKWEIPIGGWLTIILISLFLNPLITAFQIFNTPMLFKAHTWEALLSPELGLFYHALLLAFELIFNCASIIFCIFLIILFLKKRTILPRLLIIFTAITGIVFFIDNYLNLELSNQPILAYHKQKMYTLLTLVGIKTIIIVLYLLFSERVKDTFVRTLKSK